MRCLNAWLSVDRTTLAKITEDFVDALMENLLKLRHHDFIAK